MLDREGESLDLQEGRFADQAVEINTQGMCGKFSVEASAQAPEGMRMIHFNMELTRELCVHRFNHLADRVVEMAQGLWQLFLLIPPRQGSELNSVRLP